MLPVSEKVWRLINKKKSYAEVAKIYGKNESSVCEIVKEKNEFILVLLSYLRLEKLVPQYVTSA